MGNCCPGGRSKDADEDGDKAEDRYKTEPNSHEQDGFSSSSSSISYGSVSQSEPQQQRMSGAYGEIIADEKTEIPGEEKPRSEAQPRRTSAFNRRLTTQLIIRDLNQAVAADLEKRLNELNQSWQSADLHEADREEDISYETGGRFEVERHSELTTPYHLNRASSVLAPPRILVRAPTKKALRESFGISSGLDVHHHDFYRTPTFADALPRRDTRDEVIYQFAPHVHTPRSVLIYDAARKSSRTLRPIMVRSGTANELGLYLGKYDDETGHYCDDL